MRQILTALCVLSFSLGLASKKVEAQNAVVTQHNDNYRTGAYLYERQLTPRQVDPRTGPGLRLLYERVVDGAINAQLLYVPEVISRGAIHNVVYAATSNASVYAFDAGSGEQLWQRPLKDEAWIPAAERHHTVEGVLSTPVIDDQTMYVVFNTWNGVPFPGGGGDPPADLNVTFWLVALDIRTGVVLRHTSINASLPSLTVPGHTDFVAKRQVNRAGLLLVTDPINRNKKYIYVAFCLRWHEEVMNSHGWVMRYGALTLEPSGAFCTTIERREPNEGAGIWQGGSGLAADESGNVYFFTGNGNGTPPSYGNSIVRLTPARDRLGRPSFVAASFSAAADDPAHAIEWRDRDIDLGSGGPMIIPNARRLVGGGKTGVFYLLDIPGLTKVQEFPAFNNTYVAPSQYESNRFADGPDPTGEGAWAMGPHLHGAPVFWQGSEREFAYVYDWGEKDSLKAYKYYWSRARPFDETRPLLGHDDSGNIIAPVSVMPGGALSLSANGSRDGIVWVTSPLGGSGGRLLAFEATTLRKLWETPLPGTSHFTPPTIADGQVFVPTLANRFQVYALRRLIARPVEPKRPWPPIFIPRGDPAPYIAMLTRQFGAQGVARLMPPKDYAPLFAASAKGERVYISQARPDKSGKFEWVLRDSTAILVDETGTRPTHGFGGRGEVIGKHQGQVWEMWDGSRVVVDLMESLIDSKQGGLPWLLLKVGKSDGQGLLDQVTFIQQLNTQGGLPPQQEATKANVGKEVRVPYSATYVFYVPQK